MSYDPNVTTPITQALFQAQIDVDFAFEEVCWFGCSEVGGLISTGFQRDVVAVFEKYGVTPADYVADLKRRGLTDKWMYFSGLSNIVAEAEEDDYAN